MTLRHSLALMAVLFATGVQGQESVEFVHAPEFDAAAHVLFQSVARIAGAGRNTIEIADLGSFKGVSLAGRDRELVWHLTYDSLRLRTRDTAAGWREFTVPDAPSAWAQVHVDDRLRVTSVRRNQPTTGLTDPVGILTGIPGMLLPDVPLRVGGGWSTEIRGSVTGGLSAGDDLPEIPTLTVVLELVLDSAQARTRDTLAYLTLSGEIQPTSIVKVTGDDPGRFDLSGHINGSLVWSSGWSLFVSGATRVRVDIVRADTETKGEVADGVTMVKTTRYQVQP